MIVFALQLHIPGADNSNILRLNARIPELLYASAGRSYRHILASCQNCAHLLRHIAACIQGYAAIGGNLAKLIDIARLRCQLRILTGFQICHFYISTGVHGCATFNVNFAARRMGYIAIFCSNRHVLTGCQICHCNVFNGLQDYIVPRINCAILLNTLVIHLATIACRCQRYILACLERGTTRLSQETACFYSDAACCGGDIALGFKEAVCRCQCHIISRGKRSFGSYITLGSCLDISFFCRYGSVGRNLTVRAGKLYVILRLYCATGCYITFCICCNISSFRRYGAVGRNRTFRARKHYVLIRFYICICSNRDGILRHRSYVYFRGGYRAIDGYAARFCTQSHIIFGGRATIRFYSNIACIGSQADCTLCRRQVIVGGHIALSRCCYVSSCCRYRAVGRNRAVRTRQRYVLIGRYSCSGRQVTLRFQANITCSGKISAVGQSAALTEIFDRDIPCHIPIDSNGHRIGIVFDTHIPVNGRRLRLDYISIAVFHGYDDAVHSYVIELISRIFQQQGLAAHGIDLIGGDSAFVRLGDASIGGLQCHRYFRIGQISRLHRAIQRQIVIGSKRRIAAGLDGAFHRLFYNITGIVFFLFPSHGQRAFAYCDEFSLSINGSKNQRAVPDTQGKASHALYIGGSRRDVHRGAVIQDANRMIRIAHNAALGVRFEFQFLSGIDVGFGNIRISIAHLEALITFNGNRIFCVHGSQAENISIVHILDEHILVGPCLYQIPVQGNGQRFARGADAFCTAGEDQVIT